ncbi:MAG: Hpt domain-containing protein [Bacteroidetes bacterium]|nr:Hpt domain-containing protein [Bacteroidota bacterium]
MSKHSDLTFLKSFTKDDSAKISKYVNMFLDSAPKALEQMNQQLSVADWPSLKISAHSMKSQLRYMGMAAAEQLAITIERSSSEQTALDQLPQVLTKLNEIMTEAFVELKSEISAL